MINVVIFSKDRAAQLDLLLRSFKRFFNEWELCNTTIILNASNEQFKKGYELCKQLHPEFMFVDDQEVQFKRAVVLSVDDNNPITFFLVDDNLYKESVSVETDMEFQEFVSDSQILCISQRLYNGINFCYPISQNTILPTELQQGSNVWDWTKAEHDFAYPVSLDGNIYQTSIIKYLLENLDYWNPNSLEAVADMNKSLVSNMTRMICYKDNSRVVNIASNKVQTTFNNKCGNLSDVEDLNNKFLSGQQIRLEPFIGLKNNSCHIEKSYEFEDR